MLNLLFITDSPKAAYIKSVLQPVLKVIIDIVTDFDHGLKDVFEKRPATVCIQDQIGGVTGESVARHIQMLLGDSAPTFILLHTGNIKAKAIKGLYEHLIDLSQSNVTLAEDIKNTLKLLLGDQWEKIYIPPKLTAAAARPSVAVPEGSREEADKLVDDFISDLGRSGFSAANDQPPGASTHDKVAEELSAAPQPEASRKSKNDPGTAEFDRAQAINDDLAELLLMEAHKSRLQEISAASTVADEPEAVLADSQKPSAAKVKLAPSAIAGPAVPAESSSGKARLPKTSVLPQDKKDAKAASAPATSPLPPPAAGFRISQNKPLTEEQIPEDLLLTFEENYHSESQTFRRTVVIALVCIVCAAGVLYLVTKKPQLIDSLKMRFMTQSGAKQAPAAAPVAITVQTPVPARVPQPVMSQSLPVFIPKDGLDSSFAVKNPGWERYVGKLNEFRIFSASGRIQAVQVLSVKAAPISETLIKSVLQELAGSPEYLITSRSTKAGVLIESGRVENKCEVKIYRKNGAVIAFVISVN